MRYVLIALVALLVACGSSAQATYHVEYQATGSPAAVSYTDASGATQHATADGTWSVAFDAERGHVVSVTVADGACVLLVNGTPVAHDSGAQATCGGTLGPGMH